jgi:hypothetical protein
MNINDPLIEKLQLYEQALIHIGLIVHDTNLYEQKNITNLNSKMKLINKLSKVVLNPSQEYLAEVKNDLWFVEDKKIRSKFNVLNFLKRGGL